MLIFYQSFSFFELKHRKFPRLCLIVLRSNHCWLQSLQVNEADLIDLLDQEERWEIVVESKAPEYQVVVPYLSNVMKLSDNSFLIPIYHLKGVRPPHRGNKCLWIHFSEAYDILVRKVPFIFIESDRHYSILVGDCAEIKSHTCGKCKFFLPHCSLKVIYHT